MTTSKRAAGDLSGVPRSDSKRKKEWHETVRFGDGVIVIIIIHQSASAYIQKQRNKHKKIQKKHNHNTAQIWVF